MGTGSHYCGSLICTVSISLEEIQLYRNQLVVSTHLKNISQIGSFPQIRVNIKKIIEPPPSSSFQPSNQQKTQATLPTAPVLLVAANPSLVPTAPKVLGSISVPITRIQEISQVFHESQDSKSINKSF